MLSDSGVLAQTLCRMSGLQNALRKPGGTPFVHRTDSLSAAYVNTSEKRDLTDSYKALSQHYWMGPTTNNVGVSHENGALETARGSLKHRIGQAPKLRDSSDFANVAAHLCFLNSGKAE